ncbi:type 1 glutamine amidotransferase [Alicyclobacillus fodiniaquatilis]|uniref:Type 1 glutamine amidotransferase n=1 Tax=Alicyclobacillus fodiniaquatilis TaxID=1661150 RepID=A0ABW4JIR0_9BACL
MKRYALSGWSNETASLIGAQLIADALGSKVAANSSKEIGWWPVNWTDEAQETELFRGFPDRSSVFHWHGDTFELPQGATRIAQ